MSVRANVRELWRKVSSIHAGNGEAAVLPRQTQVLPLVLNPYHAGQALLPKPTPENLRRFAETPVVRRAINLIKDRVAAMQWQGGGGGAFGAAGGGAPGGGGVGRGGGGAEEGGPPRPPPGEGVGGKAGGGVWGGG